MSEACALPPLAVSLGDPAGVGPELIAACYAARAKAGPLPFFAVGGARLLRAAAATRGLAMDVVEVSTPKEATAIFPRALPVLGAMDGSYAPGAPDEDGARLALASLTRGAALAASGAASGIVTGPIAKARLADIGFTHPGQTEFVAAACGVAAQDAVMMLAGPTLRTVPLTVHVALSAVPGLISEALIVRRATIVARALARDYGIAAPRIAITALNPHAGEEGRMGDEDGRIIAPAIATLQANGIEASGPHPADGLFAPRERARYDAILCMYHDQALIPIKALEFDEGVNVTLGLPIIRTSPDHGTAFGIAGKNLAEAGATLAALRMAGQCALHRAAYDTSTRISA